LYWLIFPVRIEDRRDGRGVQDVALVWAEGERIGWASCASDGDDQEHNVGVGSNPLIRTEAVLVFPAECIFRVYTGNESALPSSFSILRQCLQFPFSSDGVFFLVTPDFLTRLEHNKVEGSESEGSLRRDAKVERAHAFCAPTTS
jgi:hypothetical protein